MTNDQTLMTNDQALGQEDVEESDRTNNRQTTTND